MALTHPGCLSPWRNPLRILTDLENTNLALNSSGKPCPNVGFAQAEPSRRILLRVLAEVVSQSRCGELWLSLAGIICAFSCSGLTEILSPSPQSGSPGVADGEQRSAPAPQWEQHLLHLPGQQSCQWQGCGAGQAHGLHGSGEYSSNLPPNLGRFPQLLPPSQELGALPPLCSLFLTPEEEQKVQDPLCASKHNLCVLSHP